MLMSYFVFFFKQKTAYEMRISDWSSDVCSSDLHAWTKFAAICEAQGGMRTPPVAAQTHPIVAARAGRVVHIDNRKLARPAKLAGAPDVKDAGIHMEKRLGEEVERGQPHSHLHAETTGALTYAHDYAATANDIIWVAQINTT